MTETQKTSSYWQKDDNMTTINNNSNAQTAAATPSQTLAKTTQNGLAGLAALGQGLRAPGAASPGLVAAVAVTTPTTTPVMPTVTAPPAAAAPVDALAKMKADLEAEIARLTAANAELAERAKHSRPSGGGGISFIVKSQTKDQATGQLVESKGCIGIYGVNTKFPISLYPQSMEKLIAAILNGDLVKAMRENPSALAFRDAKDNQVVDKAERARLGLECAARIESMLAGAAGKPAAK